MAPILLNAAANFAGNLLDNVSDSLSPSAATSATTTATTVTKQDDKLSAASFAAALLQAQSLAQAQAAAAATTTPTVADQQVSLTSSLMNSPEVKKALAGVNHSKAVQFEMNPSGGLSLRTADGHAHPVHISDRTRALVNQLYSLRQSTGAATATHGAKMVLAVDPANASAAAWSSLPARG